MVNDKTSTSSQKKYECTSYPPLPSQFTKNHHILFNELKDSQALVLFFCYTTTLSELMPSIDFFFVVSDKELLATKRFDFH